VDLQTLKSRVHDFGTRGLAKLPEQSVDDLFVERSALYRRYADVTVDCDGLTHEEVCAKIIQGLQAVRGAGRRGDPV
jgi:shikimate kinase